MYNPMGVCFRLRDKLAGPWRAGTKAWQLRGLTNTVRVGVAVPG